MAKLIITPKECAYRVLTGPKYYCEHPSMTNRYCTWTNSFPSNCPLPDGFGKTLDTEELLELVKKEIKSHEQKPVPLHVVPSR